MDQIQVTITITAALNESNESDMMACSHFRCVRCERELVVSSRRRLFQRSNAFNAQGWRVARDRFYHAFHFCGECVKELSKSMQESAEAMANVV